MINTAFNFTFYDTIFYGQYWQGNTTKAVVVLSHGMGEHSNRYKHVAQKLTDNGFAVVAFDHFGHGKTGGKRGHNPSFEAVLESVAKVIEKAKSIFPNKPIFLYGHSMGGNTIVNYVLRKTHDLKGSVATSPFLKLAFDPPAVKLFVGKLLQNIVPSLTMGNELDVNAISRDEEKVKSYIQDPFVHSKISPNYSIKFIETGDWAIENAHKLTIPMLLVHGTKDRIIDYRGTEAFVKNSKHAKLKLYEGGYHELHNDLCQEEMLQDVVDWLNSQL